MRIKEIISVSMLFLIISHGVIQFAIFKIFQTKYRTEILEVMLDDISETELVLFSFEKSEFHPGEIGIQWIEDDEFRQQNKMYDVVKKEFLGDSVYLYCIEDENESALYTYFDKYFNKLINEDPNKEKDLEGLSISLNQFYSIPPEIGTKPCNSLDENYFIVYNSNHMLDGVQFLITPPPRS